MNQMVRTFTILLLSAAALFAAEVKSTKTYRNPLVGGASFADPHVIKVGQSYYLYATTHTRGYDAYVSTNLVDW